jgi:hypothetical protein
LAELPWKRLPLLYSIESSFPKPSKVIDTLDAMAPSPRRILSGAARSSCPMVTLPTLLAFFYHGSRLEFFNFWTKCVGQVLLLPPLINKIGPG